MEPHRAGWPRDKQHGQVWCACRGPAPPADAAAGAAVGQPGTGSRASSPRGSAGCPSLRVGGQRFAAAPAAAYFQLQLLPVNEGFLMSCLNSN